MVLDHLEDNGAALRVALKNNRIAVAKEILAEIYDIEDALQASIWRLDQSEWGIRLHKIMNANAELWAADTSPGRDLAFKSWQDNVAEELLFRFALPIPGVRGVSYAIEKVDFANIYPSSMIEAVDLPTLREKLAQLPCCATNKSGEENGDPLNIVIVGRGLDALFSFIGRGWNLDEPFDLHSTYRTIQAFLFRNEYLNAPVSPLHVFNREQEVALQKARNNISLRNHPRLWLAPFTIDGLQVWIGQISRDIGIKLTTQVWYLTTHRISPDVDQDRFYLLQDLVMSGAVSRFGYVQGVGASTMPNPRLNLGGDPYVTDGLRLIVFLGMPRRAFDQIDLLDWEHPRR